MVQFNCHTNTDQHSNDMKTEETYDFKIGGYIKAWRLKRNLIQKELAARLDMNVTQMWSIENDRNSPSLRTVARIASALQVTVPQLLSLPEEHADSTVPIISKTNEQPLDNILHVGDTDLIRIMRTDDKKDQLDENTWNQLSKIAVEAIALDTKFHTSIPTTLPFSLPISKSEPGARQLALAVRAHCNMGAAILHDVLAMFEPYGIRIIETIFPDKRESITFFSPRHQNFTVFLSSSLKGDRKRSRRQFAFLSEIGRTFLFARNGFKTYRETDLSRRFTHHFAATFLLPETTVTTLVNSLHIVPDAWTWELLLRLKTRFGVSVQAFCIRLKELSLISRKRYETFDRKIRNYYRMHNHTEPEVQIDELSYRHGDLQALGRQHRPNGQTAMVTYTVH